MISETLPEDEVLLRLQINVEVLYKHIHVNQIQSLSSELDKQMPNTRVLDFDLSMNYTSEVQREVQLALWGRASIVLYTVDGNRIKSLYSVNDQR